jgi:Uma2 family endonuclease
MAGRSWNIHLLEELKMPTIQIPREQRFVLRGVDWQTYQDMLAALGDRPVRLTYDRGNLEFMTLSHGHERYSSLLGRMVETLTEELDLPLQSGGSSTFGREDLDRGLEPDRCYYLENAPQVRDKDEIDLTVDPPPDLAIEIDISRSSLNRLGIYAALRVLEVWRFDGTNLWVYLLQADGQYLESDRSRHFPFLPLAEVVAFVQRRTQMSETSLIRSFRECVREQIARGWSSPA